jgi:hypothetical protein
MSNRSKRKLEQFDPNQSDPEDLDFDATQRPSPQRRRAKQQPSRGQRKGSKRQRRGYGGSDVDEDDEILEDDSFTERSESEEVEINPSTGRSVRRAAKKQIKYEESEEDEIQDTDSQDELASPDRRRRKAKQSIEKPSLIVKLKMPAKGRTLRNRQASKSVARGKTPDVTGTRRSNRLSHDVEEPMVALSDSGNHANVVRQGTRSPEPVTNVRQTRGGKAPRGTQHSVIMEASQEDSGPRNDSPGPLDQLLAAAAAGEDEPQVQASPDPSPKPDDQDAEDDGEGDEMADVIQESQEDAAGEDDSEEEGPVTRGGRTLRVCILLQMLWNATNFPRQLGQDLPSGSALARAVTSNPLATKRKKRSCPSLSPRKNGALLPMTALLDQVDAPLAFETRGRLGADAVQSHQMMTIFPC